MEMEKGVETMAGLEMGLQERNDGGEVGCDLISNCTTTGGGGSGAGTLLS